MNSRLACCAMFLALAACGPDGPIVAGLECFPPTARPFLTDGPTTGSPARADAGETAVYIDRSGSISGYLTEDGPARPFHDLVGGLNELLDLPTGGRADYFGFATHIEQIAPASLHDLLQADFYHCRSHRTPRCDNGESHIDQVLAEVAAAPGERLSLIISDLWFANSDALATSSVVYKGPLTAILRRGQSIIIYGIVAPYGGRLSDLPSGATDVSPRRRPIYLIGIGPTERIDRLHENMRRSGSRYVVEGLADGRVPFALFSIHPQRPATLNDASFGDSTSRAIRSQTVMLDHDELRHQFVVHTAEQDASGEGPRWVGPADARFRSGAVWTGGARAGQAAWRREGESCRFTRVDAENLGWAPTDNGRYAFEPDPRAMEQQLGLGTFLITGAVLRTSIALNNPATQWMRDWSFREETESAARARPDFFPTLNLAELARLMEYSLDDASRGQPVSGFTILARVER